ncbi:P44/Msp2 family outer membrane protein [Anaplasma phagocytophilum]|uniref:p44-71 outer membrane protein n=1 Tax=Anaplasma phagocytophilum TaxID=948 RepID=A0A098GJE8_ANAPH|nr:P44/Msp2 family outer membrane protein [Anaplasma phagocytophilum]CEH11130.1 P44-71 outer membrane protein [Anaplasma phagocytophilum]
MDLGRGRASALVLGVKYMRVRSYSNLFLAGVMASIVGVTVSNAAKADQDYGASLDARRSSHFYIGLDYSPASSKIRGFKIRESSGETAAVYPYFGNGDSPTIEYNRFDWDTPNPRIGFKDNTLLAIGSSIGYAFSRARVEVEVGYESFKIKDWGKSGKKEKDGSAVYLLAKELAYSLASNQQDKLAVALSKVEGKDIVNFAKALESTSPTIGEKVCRTRSGSGENNYARYSERTSGLKVSDNNTALCGDIGGHRGHSSLKVNIFKDFIAKTLGDGSRNWPTSTGSKSTENDNANAVAADLVKNLTMEEKGIVAGLFSRTIEGGEAAKISAISTTSVMLNVCYDFYGKESSIAPYACAGIGSNFVGIVDSHIVPKLAYKLKAGIGCQISPEISIFAGGFYHRILGDGRYADLPVKRLFYDESPKGRTKNTAVANFSMSYAGGEFGVRLAF